jgi:hypothetical protein
MTQNSGRSAQDFCDGLIQHVAAWCGSSDREQHDDLTLIVVDYKAA